MTDVHSKPSVIIDPDKRCGVMAVDQRQAAWDFVDRRFKPEGLFGAVGADVVRRGAARASVHEFGYSLCLQASLLGCVNGASIAAWPGKPSPLSLVVMVANPQQTRKSQTSNVMNEIGKAVDAVCRERASQLGLSTGLELLLMTSFTEAAFFQRTSAGWAQHVSGERLHFSSMLAVDESYRLLRMLGLVGEHGKKEKDSSPCDGASQWNTLLQTGHSNLACKTGVSYQAHRAVNVAAVGNLHLGPLMAMLRGEIGQHEAASLERILICSAQPVAPHAPLPDALQLPDNAERLVWVPLLRSMLQPLALPESCLTEETARESFEEDADGAFIITLSDGTQTRLRFRPIATWAQISLNMSFRFLLGFEFGSFLRNSLEHVHM